MRPGKTCWAALTSLFLLAGHAGAQTGENVLVVANEGSPASIEIAEYYVKRRHVPADQLLKIKTSTADQITRAEFEATIQGPVANWLAQQGAQDRILFIVLTKGVPLRIAGTGGRTGTVSSVDSELTLLYRRMTGQTVAPNGSVPNPYFLGELPPNRTARFSHATHDIYLVTRLDGFTVDDAKALVDRGVEPVTTGRILLDQRAGLNQKPNDWLAEAAKRLVLQGLKNRVVLEETSRVVEPEKGVLGYYSWGSNDPSITERHPGLDFAPGALAAMFVSSDARTFSEPPAGWKPGQWQDRQSYFAGSPQSLSGDLVRAGATGTAGYVAEPYLDSSVRPDILFPAYTAGFTLAESFYLALPTLSWQSVVVGDPLCGPFRKASAPTTDLNPPLDKETELPAFFSARRLESADLKTDAATAKLFVRAESRLNRGDTAGARQTLEQVVAKDESLTVAWRALALLYDGAADHTKAVAAYRKVVERDPKDAVSLNNLAYSMAVREGNPKEALPFAERALLLAPRNPVIADTVGWIKFLLGDNAGALKILEPAAKALPRSAEVQLHAAAAYAAAGRVEDAAAALKAAETADPAVKQRSEYIEVQKKIGRQGNELQIR
jgi:uncharacterized protein (TIGR03790 family)